LASLRNTVVARSSFTAGIVSLTCGLPVYQVMRHTRRVIRQPPALRTRRQPPLQKVFARADVAVDNGHGANRVAVTVDVSPAAAHGEYVRTQGPKRSTR
jgi:hypothetical protein